MTEAFSVLSLLVFSWLFAVPAAFAATTGRADSSLHRFAVVVGSNGAAPGRPKLRFAYNDAKQVAAALEQTGHFRSSDVEVLLDPTPQVLLADLDEAIAGLHAQAGESLLFFYYSGHADQQNLYPQGLALPLEQLKARLDHQGVSVRIGFVDACRGGGSTQAKDFHAEAPFSVDVPFALNNEGSVLISSSSGVENAHESELLRGSFFTHHFVAGMLGAADRSGDGKVSLSEVFAYAKDLTVRDSTLFANAPQHPSFDMNLHGRQDLILAEVDSAPSVVSFKQEKGPLQIVHLATGLVVIELPAGARVLKVALPPGKYLVRRQGDDGIFARELEVRAGAVEDVNEEELKFVEGSAYLAIKGPEATPRHLATTVPAHLIELSLAIGAGDLDGVGNAVYGFSGPGTWSGNYRFSVEGQALWGLTDRLTWQIGTGTFAYRLGDTHHVEVVPWGGISQFWFANWQLGYTLALGADLWVRLPAEDSLIFNFKGWSNADASLGKGASSTPPNDWRTEVTAGMSLLFRNRVSLNFGVGTGQNLFVAGQVPPPRQNDRAINWQLEFGSVQRMGLKALPLLQFHIFPWLSIDLHARVAVPLQLAWGNTLLTSTFMVGSTFSFVLRPSWLGRLVRLTRS